MLNADKILNVDHKNFQEVTFNVFHFQYKNNPVYKSYCNLLKKNPAN
ncbi:MAG: acyl transferase, partial [Flavobacteriaceae bacterium]|nr:acyl transferase [Flavobacteriaceae bacterium]